MNETLATIAIVGIHLSCALAICLLSLLFTKSEKTHLILVFSLFFLATIGILFIPTLPALQSLNWNWQGKFLSILLALLFLYNLPFLTKAQAGFTLKVNKSVWLPFFVLTILAVGYNVYQINNWDEVDKTKEYLLFQLTMPGFSEELIFRGILLGLLNLVFVTRKNILGAKMGIGSLIQAVLFGVGHAVYFDQAQHLQFFTAGFIESFILGAFMTYLKEKGESIVPAILFHNCYNSSLALVVLFR